eukprot:TRINITY_DN890_c0_g1_i10.p1 TRINITY_DN890_c0_g1~~TRINITY_DN890_c0_g1_i10.p1  ORF type:complete len:211 (-),score=18.34 TRINITY_DN890_c0_g1_i10:3662-4294(-)
MLCARLLLRVSGRLLARPHFAAQHAQTTFRYFSDWDARDDDDDDARRHHPNLQQASIGQRALDNQQRHDTASTSLNARKHVVTAPSLSPSSAITSILGSKQRHRNDADPLLEEDEDAKLKAAVSDAQKRLQTAAGLKRQSEALRALDQLRDLNALSCGSFEHAIEACQLWCDRALDLLHDMPQVSPGHRAHAVPRCYRAVKRVAWNAHCS